MSSIRTLVLLVALLVTASSLSAKSSNSSAKAAAAKRQAQLDELKKKDAERTQMATQYYNDVHTAVPNVTVDEIKNMSPQDIRALYVKSYVAQGTPKAEAIGKASSLKIYGQ
jgi:hypothetical protein